MVHIVVFYWTRKECERSTHKMILCLPTTLEMLKSRKHDSFAILAQVSCILNRTDMKESYSKDRKPGMHRQMALLCIQRKRHLPCVSPYWNIMESYSKDRKPAMHIQMALLCSQPKWHLPCVSLDWNIPSPSYYHIHHYGKISIKLFLLPSPQFLVTWGTLNFKILHYLHTDTI